VAFVVVWLMLFATWIFCLVDVARQPPGIFEAIGRSKVGWILRLVLFGWIAALVYLVSVRGKLTKVVHAGVTPAAPRERVPLRKKDWGDPFES
jgi:hypothetical protein